VDEKTNASYAGLLIGVILALAYISAYIHESSKFKDFWSNTESLKEDKLNAAKR